MELRAWIEVGFTLHWSQDPGTESQENLKTTAKTRSGSGPASPRSISAASISLKSRILVFGGLEQNT